MLTLIIFFSCFLGCQLEHDGSTVLEANVLSACNASTPVSEEAKTSATNVVFQSTDGGKTWQDVSLGLPEDVSADCIFASGTEVLLGTESGLYHRNTNSTAAWENEILLDQRITEIFPGKAGPFACSSGNGFFQEIAGTGVWIPLHKNLQDKSVCTVLETPDGALFAGCYSGIFKSTNNGLTWKRVFDDGAVTSLVTADGVLVGGGGKGVLRSSDAGEHWAWVLKEDGAATQTGLVAGGFGAVTFDGWTKRLRTSVDKGKTWQLQDDSQSWVNFSRDIKQVGQYLFYSQPEGVMRSTDQGKTWKLVFPSKGKSWFDLTVSGQVIFAIKLEGC